MTAIAFLLIVCGVLIIRMFGCTIVEQRLGLLNKADYVGGAMFFIGMIMFIFLIFNWLWRVMP